MTTLLSFSFFILNLADGTFIFVCVCKGIKWNIDIFYTKMLWEVWGELSFTLFKKNEG
jgi:hypothetical protein